MQLKNGLKNMVILLVAPILALGLFYFSHNLWGLSASVLDVLELQTIEKNKRWVAYKTQNQIFELFGSVLVKKEGKLIFEVLYDPLSLTVDISSATPSSAKLRSNQSGLLMVELPIDTNAELEKEWFSIPFSGAAKDILLGSASFEAWDKSIALAVWNLNTPAQDEDSLLP